MELTGANRFTKVEGTDRLPGTANYFIGNDPSKWHTNVPTYAKVSYKNVYPGVDILYYGNQRQLEYDFVVQPQANPKQIKLHFAGAKKLSIDQNGDLDVTAGNGQMGFHKPVIYQIKEGRHQPVEGTFILKAHNQVGFKLGSYDQSQELVIDPTLSYSTYLGGSSFDRANAIAVDDAGNTYVTGYTDSTDFPVTAGAFQKVNKGVKNGSPNAFITKLNGAGSALIYSTYLGGSGGPEIVGGDVGNGIAVDAPGNAYVTGSTYSTDFPVTIGAFQKTNKAAADSESNAFVTKLNPTGSGLVYSTLLGGTVWDIASGIAVDKAGDAYVTGSSYSTDFPVTSDAFQKKNKAAANQATDAFVTKLDPTGSGLVYSSFLGGSGVGVYGGDFAYGIALDTAGDAYVAGAANSNDFPTTSLAFQKVNHAHTNFQSNGFVTKLNATGSALTYSTYLGGSGESIGVGLSGDQVNAITVDVSGDAYVTGVALSPDFPVTSGAFQTINKGAPEYLPNAFVTKLNPSGSALVYSTFLGGSGEYVGTGDTSIPSYDSGNGIAVDSAGAAYISGYSGSTDFPLTSKGFQKFNGAALNAFTSGSNGETAFLTKLNPAGSSLIYSTYFGGSIQDSSAGTAMDAAGNIYIAGYTQSPDFPVTKRAFQTENEGASFASDAFIAKFTFADPTATTTTLVSDGNPEPVGAKVTFTAGVTGKGVTPTGRVGFSIDGGTPIEVVLDDTGHADFSTTTLSAGVHKIVAAYSGDAANLPSTSNTLSETIGDTPTAYLPSAVRTVTDTIQ